MELAEAVRGRFNSSVRMHNAEIQRRTMALQLHNAGPGSFRPDVGLVQTSASTSDLRGDLRSALLLGAQSYLVLNVIL